MKDSEDNLATLSSGFLALDKRKTEIEHERDEAATELRKSRISQAAALGHSMGLAARAEAAAARAEAEACRVQELQRQLAAAQTGAKERHAGRTLAMSPADLLQLSVDAVNMSGANPESYLAFLQERDLLARVVWAQGQGASWAGVSWGRPARLAGVGLRGRHADG